MAEPSVVRRLSSEPSSRDSMCTRPVLSPTTTERPRASGAVSPRCSSRSLTQARSPLSRRQASTLPSASVPNTSWSSPFTPSAPLAGLVHSTRAAGRVDAAHRGLEGARAHRVADPADAADQVDQALDVVDAARRGQRRFPADAAVERIQPDHAAGQADHQRVAHGQHHAGLAQHQRLAGALLGPQLAAGLAVEGASRRGRPSARRRGAPATKGARVRHGASASGARLPCRRTSATSSLSRVTTAASLPSLPTPAASGAPTLARHRSRPVAASIAATVPSLLATRDGAAVDVDRQRQVDLADARRPGRPHRDQRRHWAAVRPASAFRRAAEEGSGSIEQPARPQRQRRRMAARAATRNRMLHHGLALPAAAAARRPPVCLRIDAQRAELDLDQPAVLGVGRRSPCRPWCIRPWPRPSCPAGCRRRRGGRPPAPRIPWESRRPAA